MPEWSVVHESEAPADGGAAAPQGVAATAGSDALTGPAPAAVWVPVGNVRGPQGETGEPGVVVPYAYRQGTPAATWTIQHGLRTCPPLVLILDENPSEPVFTDVTYPDLDTAVVEWPAPVTGWAHTR